MFIGTYYDAADRVEAIVLSRPASSDDTVSYSELAHHAKVSNPAANSPGVSFQPRNCQDSSQGPQPVR
jgi:hypothetical protein